MKAGRELDRIIARDVMGHSVTQQKREVFEGTPEGTRPLRAYSTDIAAAWEVAEKVGVSLIPVEHHAWFALVGDKRDWKSPAEYIQFIQTADFVNAGAAVGESAPLTICIAALKALEKRRAAGQNQGETGDGEPESKLHH